MSSDVALVVLPLSMAQQSRLESKLYKVWRDAAVQDAVVAVDVTVAVDVEVTVDVKVFVEPGIVVLVLVALFVTVGE
jgi:hypothetical protein